MTRATSLKGLWGNLRFLVVWKTWAALIIFAVGVAVGVAVGAAWCLADVKAGEPGDGAERLDSGDGAAARAAGFARLLPDAAVGDAGALRVSQLLRQDRAGVRMGPSVRRGSHGPPADRILRPRRSV